MLKLCSRFTVKRGGFTTCGSLAHHRGSFSIFERCRTLVCCFYPGGMWLTSIRRANSSGFGSCCRVFPPFTFSFGALLYQSRQSLVCSRPVSVMDPQFLRPPVCLLSVLLCQLSAWLMPGRLFGWTLIPGIAGLPSSSALRDKIKSLRRGAEGLTSPAVVFICWLSAGGESALLGEKTLLLPPLSIRLLTKVLDLFMPSDGI